MGALGWKRFKRHDLPASIDRLGLWHAFFYHDLKGGSGISASYSLSQGGNECLAHFLCSGI